MVTESRSDVALLYRRGGFGLRPEELDRLAAGGYEAAVEGLLAGLVGPDPGGDAVPVPAFSAPPLAASAGGGGSLAARQARNRAVAQDLTALQTWWLDRMISTSTPLREKLTLFWHGHFATGSSKVRDARLMYQQNELFRTTGAGGFQPLMEAVARDGAMMIWLDTNTDKKAHPNENFAREMMELFTLGIGNYTQDDVTAGARAFTGWAFNRSADRFVFQPSQHDFGLKTYLGQTGDWNGQDAVRIAVTRLESARFVLSRLWSHFAYPVAPSDPVVDDLVTAYGRGMDVGSALRAVFLHPAFRSPVTRAGLVKQPAEYLAGAARALRLDASLNGRGIHGGGGGTSSHRPVGLARLSSFLGQTLFDPPNVGGWGQNSYWIDTATAQLRLEAALLMASRSDLSALSSLPQSQRVAGVANLLGLDGWGPTTSRALTQISGDPVQLTALALVSPEYVLA